MLASQYFFLSLHHYFTQTANIIMKAKVIYPKGTIEREENDFSNSLKSSSMELKMSETSLSHYKMTFMKAGNGLNVIIEENCNNGKVVSQSKNFECMVRKLILAEKIINNVSSKALRNCSMFNSNQTEEEKGIAKALDCAYSVAKSFINGDTRLEDDDIEFICKAAAYKKEK